MKYGAQVEVVLTSPTKPSGPNQSKWKCISIVCFHCGFSRQSTLPPVESLFRIPVQPFVDFSRAAPRQETRPFEGERKISCENNIKIHRNPN